MELMNAGKVPPQEQGAAPKQQMSAQRKRAELASAANHRRGAHVFLSQGTTSWLEVFRKVNVLRGTFVT